MTDQAPSPPPPPTHVLETCLYVKDMNVAAVFYKDVLQLNLLFTAERITGFSLGNTTLLLFQLGLTEGDSVSERGRIPGHGPTEVVLKTLNDAAAPGSLHQHYCLAVETPDDVRLWEDWFEKRGTKTLGTMDWESGGRSVYFADPDGHIGEVGSRGIWPHY